MRDVDREEEEKGIPMRENDANELKPSRDRVEERGSDPTCAHDDVVGVELELVVLLLLLGDEGLEASTPSMAVSKNRTPKAEEKKFSLPVASRRAELERTCRKKQNSRDPSPPPPPPFFSNPNTPFSFRRSSSSSSCCSAPTLSTPSIFPSPPTVSPSPSCSCSCSSLAFLLLPSTSFSIASPPATAPPSEYSRS
ncbi:hypothetical protein BDY24DRAFT_381924 [Mrakia frigida]|uniref:uncharacterized protein n=1 Tax=Mrakia frigida TaxID=29902 RepID=UPI003FCC0F0D